MLLTRSPSRRRLRPRHTRIFLRAHKRYLLFSWCGTCQLAVVANVFAKTTTTMPLTRPPARRSIRDRRGNPPETLYKLLCHRVVQGSPPATSNNDTSLRRGPDRQVAAFSSPPFLLF